MLRRFLTNFYNRWFGRRCQSIHVYDFGDWAIVEAMWTEAPHMPTRSYTPSYLEKVKRIKL